MFIGEIAAEAGVTVQTVRFYERRGLMRRAARSASGYRHYEPVDLDILKTIAQCQGFGFTLAEIREILSLFWVPDPKTGRPRHKPNETQCLIDACDLGAQKLARLDAEIAQMQQSRAALVAALEAMRARVCERQALDPHLKDRPQTSPASFEGEALEVHDSCLCGVDGCRVGAGANHH
jgi:DNA-binding transcriptional MerR regulator